MSLLRRSTLLLVLGAALVSACLSRSTRGGTPLFTLADARGDDHGDGYVRYPMRDDMQPGSLDLLLLVAYPEDDGTRFEATFARPIVKPQSARTLDIAGETQAERARFGFYTFNLDIYVDTDRVPGSGRTVMLPGRKLTLAPDSAWEKLIVLTPRPYEARDQLRRTWLTEMGLEGAPDAASQRDADAVAAGEMATRVFFPTQIRVTGATVEFFVPNQFFGGPPRPEWGYAPAVTGALLENKIDLLSFFGKESEPTLMVLPIGPGDSRERLGGGRRDDPGQSPVVDLMVPEGITQEQVLGPNAPPWPAVVPARPTPPQPAPAPVAPDASPSVPEPAPAPVAPDAAPPSWCSGGLSALL
jgi:hypothetical protein